MGPTAQAFEEACGANCISLMASVVPSEACGAHPAYTTQVEGIFSSVGCFSASEEARGANHVSPIVPSEACEDHPMVTLSSNVLLGVTLSEEAVELIMYL